MRSQSQRCCSMINGPKSIVMSRQFYMYINVPTRIFLYAAGAGCLHFKLMRGKPLPIICKDVAVLLLLLKTENIALRIRYRFLGHIRVGLSTLKGPNSKASKYENIKQKVLSNVYANSDVFKEIIWIPDDKLSVPLFCVIFSLFSPLCSVVKRLWLSDLFNLV